MVVLTRQLEAARAELASAEAKADALDELSRRQAMLLHEGERELRGGARWELKSPDGLGSVCSSLSFSLAH